MRNITDIQNQLESIGYNLNNDKVLKEPAQHLLVLFEIFACTIRWCTGKSQAEMETPNPHLIYLVDLQKHQKGIQWNNICECMKKLFKGLKIKFALKKFFKPDKEFVINTLSALFAFGKFRQEKFKQHGKRLFDKKQAQRNYANNEKQLENIEIKFKQLMNKKQQESGEYKITMDSIANINKSIAEKKEMKNDQINQKKVLQERLEAQRKQFNERSKKLKDKQNQIVALQKQIAENIPEIKQERNKVQQQHSNSVKEYENLKRTVKIKIQNINNFVQHTSNQIKIFHQNVNDIVDNINKRKDLQTQINEIEQRVKNKVHKHSIVRAEITQANQQINNLKKSIENFQTQQSKTEIDLKNITNEIKKLKMNQNEQIQNNQEGLKFIAELDNMRVVQIQKIEKCCREHSDRVTKLEQKMSELQRQYIKNLNQIYEPISGQ